MFNLNSAPFLMHEFFAGSGLVALATRGDFKPIWANDIDQKKEQFYKLNFGEKHFHLGDISDVHGYDLPNAHLSWASFPCQDLSLAGKMQGIRAKRSGLVWQWLRIISEMQNPPKVLALENVAGFISAHGGENYREVHEALHGMGYQVGAMLINSDCFIPQSRPRVFVVAVKGINIPNELKAQGPIWIHPEYLKKFANLKGWVWWNLPKPNKKVKQFSDLLENVPFDKDEVLSLIAPQHQTILDASDNVYATGYKRTRAGKQFLELRFDGIAGCLRTPSGGSSRQYVIVKKDGQTHARLLTAREVVRLMGAPDSYQIPFSYNETYKAMGDAVALPVVKHLSEHLLRPLAEIAYH